MRDYFCMWPHIHSNRWPKPRVNRANMFRKMNKHSIKRAMTIHYFGKPKSWSNNFHERVMGYA